ncbi:DUF4239 domain-containing protein [Actinospica sp.]|uniref:bestrophin-like domain n=1 Tax=Actinospica sp. TaxID=1872142 RepID=UPI002B6924D8|nr:DUF4239 domain-containing protein [Actinospica sp.]HWG24759.1 DUF4239 domain-containing protein [Actinospica sp.]
MTMIWVVLGVAMLAILAHVIVARRAAGAEEHAHHEAAATDYVNLLVSAVYLLLVAFIIVVLWQRQEDISSDVRSEASDLGQLTWIAHRLPGSDHTMLHSAVQDYTTAVLAHEWPASSASDTAPAWQASQNAISHLATTFSLDQQTTLRDEAISLVADVQQNRSDRLAKSAEGLPGPLLATFAIVSAATVLLPYLLRPRIRAHSVIGLTISVGLVVASAWLVLDLLHPYDGLLAVSPEPLRSVLAQLTIVS